MLPRTAARYLYRLCHVGFEPSLRVAPELLIPALESRERKAFRAVHMNGLGWRSFSSRYSWIAWTNSLTLKKLPRRIRFSVSRPNQRSTKFNQDELVGMKWRWNRRCRASQLFTLGCVCVP